MENYEGREQSAVKHLVLSDYLEKLAYKVGSFRPDLTLNYIDGFAGPWESKDPDLSDTSPALALRKLLEVRDQLARRGKSISVRAFFVSLTNEGVEQLSALKTQFASAEIEVVKSTFEAALDAARRFAGGGHNPFTFVFIDHKGWTGFGLREITPLLREGNNEVLINFMTGHITRFIDSGDGRYEYSFDELFGDPSCREQWRGLTGLDREDQIVKAYCQRVAQAGGYKHCVSNVILNPRVNRTHFHLVYGTRSDEGLVTFRGVERNALKFQQAERAGVQQRDRVQRSGQGELFGGPALVAHTYEDELRARYRARADAELETLMRNLGEVPWDTLILAALQTPMIAESEVKDWLKDAQRSGTVEVIGLAPREKVPKRGQNHRIRRVKSR
jgi:three-Cys-motif partner protein